MIGYSCLSAHLEISKFDKTESLVTISDMIYVREVTETDFYYCMRLCFQFDSIYALSEFA